MFDATVWLAQGFLGLFFLAAGAPKVIGRGIDRWIGFADLPRPLTILIGVSEVSAAIAIVVPMLIGDYQWLTVLAALGLAAVSLMASGFHIRAARSIGGVESLCAVETALWASLAATVAVGRWDELSTAPSVPADLLVPVIGVLIVAVTINLVVVARRPVQTTADRSVAAPRPRSTMPS
ncbi:MAG: DoxX family protein [Nocardioides sp.]